MKQVRRPARIIMFDAFVE